MKNIKSKLFEKFNNETIEMNNLSSIKGGVGDTRVTGDTDCTGDYTTPDCGDGSETNRDSISTTPEQDSCNS